MLSIYYLAPFNVSIWLTNIMRGSFGFQASEYFCCLPRVIAVGETGTGQKTHLSFFYGSLRPLPSVLGKIPARLLVRYFAARVLGL